MCFLCTVNLQHSHFRCPARECHKPDKCQGDLVDSFSISHLEECIDACKDKVSCNFYTFDKASDHCVLYEHCRTTIPCDSCARGEKHCSRGYHGKQFYRHRDGLTLMRWGEMKQHLTTLI